jgi:hypothetical protein
VGNCGGELEGKRGCGTARGGVGGTVVGMAGGAP